MTYKFRLGCRPQWVLESGDDSSSQPLHDMLSLLAAIDATGNIAGACKVCRMSYRHAWGTLRRFEALFGTPLLITNRRQGTRLSEFAQRLLWANRRIEARLMPMLESMASELQEELERFFPQTQPHLRLHASHGFAVEALVQQMGGQEPGVELRYRTASEALAALQRQECDVAGFQVPMGPFEAPILARYAPWLSSDDYLLIHLAARNTGLFVQPGNPKSIRGMADLARADVRFVNRQIGSSTRHLVSLMLEQLGVSVSEVQGYATNEFTHMAIAAHIASGMADTGVGVETAARRFGLDFIHLVRERYFFAIRRNALDTPGMRRLLSILRSDAYLSYVSQLVGYDTTHTGQLQSLEEAFGAGGCDSL